MISKRGLIVSLSAAALALSACTLGPGNSQLPLDPPQKVPELSKPTAGTAPGETIVGFDEVYSKVFQQSCDRCHQNDDQPLLRNYSDYFANASQIKRQVIDLRKMPKRKQLSSEQIALVKIWLDQGAQEFSRKNEESPTAPPTQPQQPSPPAAPPSAPSSEETSKPTENRRPVPWESVKASFFDKKCANCHYTGNTDGLSDYEDVATVKATIGTIFYTVVISPVMPPPPKDWNEATPNPNQLTREQKDLLSQWIVDGMK